MQIIPLIQWSLVWKNLICLIGLVIGMCSDRCFQLSGGGSLPSGTRVQPHFSFKWGGGGLRFPCFLIYVAGCSARIGGGQLLLAGAVWRMWISGKKNVATRYKSSGYCACKRSHRWDPVDQWQAPPAGWMLEDTRQRINLFELDTFKIKASIQKGAFKAASIHTEEM